MSYWESQRYKTSYTKAKCVTQNIFALQLQKLKIAHFKNYSDRNFEFHPRLNLILGNNGTGKTNLLDAIYYLAFGKSYYSIPDRNLIRFQQNDQSDPFFRLDGYSQKPDHFSMSYSPARGKTISKNGVEYERLSDHIGEIPLVSVFPEDIYLIRHGSILRRRFVDGTIGQLDRNYLHALLHYNRILRQKNELLKNRRFSGRDKLILVEKYDAELVPLIVEIESARSVFVKQFDPLFSSYYHKIAQNDHETAEVVYARSLNTDDIKMELNACRSDDLAKGRATKGPHKDDFRILLNQERARYFASQGQQKSILFSLKLAQYAYIQQALKRNPVLLLDDFFEKLDEHRINHVMAILASEHPGQIFVTDTDANRMIKMAKEAGLDYQAIYMDDL